MNKTLPIVNGVALVSTIVMNYLSNTGVFNGQTMKTVSDSYFNYFTPAGYAFSIWGLIYLGILAFVIYSGLGLFNKNFHEPMLEKVGWWFAISCVANSLWVVAWLYLYSTLSVILMLVILFSLIKIMLNTRMAIDKQPIKTRLLVYLPFSLYLGWISVATIANIAACLTKTEWTALGISEEHWAVMLIIVAGILNTFALFTRNLRAFTAVGIWALMAIASSNNDFDGPKSVILTCYIVAVILAILILLSFIKKRQSPL